MAFLDNTYKKRSKIEKMNINTELYKFKIA